MKAADDLDQGDFVLLVPSHEASLLPASYSGVSFGSPISFGPKWGHDVEGRY